MPNECHGRDEDKYPPLSDSNGIKTGYQKSRKPFNTGMGRQDAIFSSNSQV